VPDIFLSYNREDQARAKLFAEAFEREGFKVWWDVGLRTGEAYDEVTETALRTAKAVVVLWSKKSVVSRWVRAEATLADRNKTLLPVMIESCERPIMFELTQTADLGNWQGATDDTAWLAFLGDVKRFVTADRGTAQVLWAPTTMPPIPARHAERGEPPSLAVLPFTNRSGLPEDEAFADGMVEDIVAALAFSPDLKVLAAGAAAAWRGKAFDLREVSQALGVRYVLEGNVRRIGHTLRVTAQLSEAESGAVLWMQKFDQPLAELVALQEQLITAVAAHLHVKVRILEGERALKATGDLTVHQILLRAESMLQGRLTDAVAEARRAVEIAPDHGFAHAVLASGLGMQLLELGGSDLALHEEILTVVGRALALSPNDPAAIWRCASALVFVGRPDDGLHHIDRVLALTPDNPMAFHVLSLIHIRLGQGDEALSSLGSWERLAPGSRLLFISLHLKALAHFLRDEQDSAIDAIDKAFRLNPQYSMTLLTRAALKSLAGAGDDARASIRALRLVEPSTRPERFEHRATMMVAPWAATALNTAFRKVWDETPLA